MRRQARRNSRRAWHLVEYLGDLCGRLLVLASIPLTRRTRRQRRGDGGDGGGETYSADLVGDPVYPLAPSKDPPPGFAQDQIPKKSKSVAHGDR